MLYFVLQKREQVQSLIGACLRLTQGSELHSVDIPNEALPEEGIMTEEVIPHRDPLEIDLVYDLLISSHRRFSYLY